MSTNEQTPLGQPTSAVRNTLGKKHALQDSVKPVSDEALREYCDKNYHQILPIIAEKVHQEKVRREEEGTLRKGLDLGVLEACPKARNQGTAVPNHQRRKIRKEEQCSKDWKKGVFHRLGDKEKIVSAHSKDSGRKSCYSSRSDTKSCYQSSRSRETEIAFEKHRHKRDYSRRTKAMSESEGSAGGHWKSKPKKQKSSVEDDLSQPWVCEETYPFTPRIRYFDFPRTRMPSHIKTYDGSEDPEDHLKIFQAAAKMERWAMPTWCHMFNSTLTGNARVWFDDLPKESIDSYDDLRKAFLENYLQ
ncbi:reverse transcriptase domain-containing protein [Tanacetum coccineum]